MEVFEYLPQLIVAYDSNDEFANLIHVKKAKQDSDYYCPCCGKIVKPRAMANTKEQSHYYHLSDECVKKSQLHFFYKNWLFEAGSKFYIDGELFEVKSLDIEKEWNTRFGEYTPDVTVYTTSGKTIYFEIFFSNRKTSDNYFCKWSALGNSVVEINIKDYMAKMDKDTVPLFSYLYHDGKCYSKLYIKRDLYANTIGKIKKELTRKAPIDYKSRIEQFDCFWQAIIGNTSRDEIIRCIRSMPYEDMVSCYEIIKKKQCVSYLKKDVLNTINQQVISNIRDSLCLPFDENVYFDLEHINGRTYEIGIRLKILTEHVTYDQFYLHCCCDNENFKKSFGYPKIVFTKNIFTIDEIIIPENKMEELRNIFHKTVQYKSKLLEYEKELSELENDGYRIRLNNNLYTVLAKMQGNKFEPIFEKYYLPNLSIELLLQEIQCKVKEKADKKFLENYISGEKAQALITALQNYKDIGVKVHVGYKKQDYASKEDGIFFDLSLYDGNIYSRMLSANEDDFLEAIEFSKKKIDEFIDEYRDIIDLMSKINSCKNGFWKAELLFDSHGKPKIRIDQAYINSDMLNMTYEEIDLSDFELSNQKNICDILFNKMKSVMKNMERYGYRIMEVRY